MDYPAGGPQAAAQGFYRLRVPPALRPASHPVFHMKAAKGKAAPFPEPGKGIEHGRGIGSPGHGGEEYRPPRPDPQAPGHPLLKNIHGRNLHQKGGIRQFVTTQPETPCRPLPEPSGLHIGMDIIARSL
jgi:hypothetical protein